MSGAHHLALTVRSKLTEDKRNVEVIRALVQVGCVVAVVTSQPP